MNENTLKLLDAMCEAYDIYQTPKDVTGDGKPETFCNLAVQHVCGRMGYEKFKGLVANQMIDFMRRSFDWEKIEMSRAQELTNGGRLVLAGQQAQGHGHVAVIRPGVAEFSGSWNEKAPKACNVGATSFIGKRLSFAFKQKPEFWVLKDAI